MADAAAPAPEAHRMIVGVSVEGDISDLRKLFEDIKTLSNNGQKALRDPLTAHSAINSLAIHSILVYRGLKLNPVLSIPRILKDEADAKEQADTKGKAAM